MIDSKYARFLKCTCFSRYSGNVVGSAPYEVGSPACTNYGMQPSQRYSGLCSASYVSTANYNNNNLQNNYVSQNTYTFKSETFNPPTFQLQKPAYTAVQQPQPQNQQQPQPQPQSVVQTAFKPFVQSVVQPVANNFINTDYSFKSIFDRFKDVLRLQHVVPQQSQAIYAQPPGQQQYNYQQPAAYVPTTYVQQPSVYSQQPALQPSFQQPSPVYQQQTFQQPAVQQTAYQQQQQLYYQQQQQQAQDTRNSAFLTYDWSQLFNNNNNYQAK